MIKILEILGSYLIFLGSLLKRREKLKIYFEKTMDEIITIGIDSISMVILISIFMGVVTSIQTASNLNNPFVPKFIVGMATRNMSVLELSPTVIGIIITGKIGSSIASQIASMRISEQIDALEILGVNSASYLVLPKILASVFSYPLLVIISMFLCITAGYFAAIHVANISSEDYILGITSQFKFSEVKIALYKSTTFGFLMSSISSFIGFNTKDGGSVEVGKASTKAFTLSSIIILIADCFIARLFLNF